MPLSINYWRNVNYFSGLAGLVADGAPADAILAVRSDERRENGITDTHEALAKEAIDNAEKLGRCASIIKNPHMYWRCITDAMLFSLNEFLIINPNGSVVIHPFGELDDLIRKEFSDFKHIDNAYYLFTRDTDTVIQFFRDYQLKKSA